MKNSYLLNNGITEFRPLVAHSHPLLQTIVPYLIPYNLKYKNKQHLKIELADNDALIVSVTTPQAWSNGDKIVILMHGLAGSEDSSYIKRVGDKFYEQNINVIRVNLRSCGPGFGLAMKPYHSGRSDDAREVVKSIAKLNPRSEIYLIGFSLSANIIVKLLGEGTENLKTLKGAVSVSPPLDLEKSAHKITALSYGIFDKFFLSHLKKQVQKLSADFPQEERTHFPKKMNLIDFDDLYTAPRSGFVDAKDYYQKCSGKEYIADIKTPMLLLHSIDDPVVESNCIEYAKIPSCVDVVETKKGGHVGFLSNNGFWSDSLILNWVHKN